jgi:hypothetical protein
VWYVVFCIACYSNCRYMHLYCDCFACWYLKFSCTTDKSNTNFLGSQWHYCVQYDVWSSTWMSLYQLKQWRSNMYLQRLWWCRGSVLPLSTQVRGFKPGRSRQHFSGRKNLHRAFLRRRSKAVGPMSQIYSM